ncbi:hypothetical protein [Bacillus sp. AFS017336]|uniref:hypothetical protein n=1 Tax=Bacillus sp. AFS017336 TaxID=2033489 RepID=UPI000BF06D22|nr:hypothetical protein [Bacillus sp. AFS017336]PEL09904.1 hypothetical protein CN601_15300 [Bacillus sp. AFS017336]
MRRNKNMALIAILWICMVIFIIVNAVRHIRIYMVYNSGLMPFIVCGMFLFAIIILYVSGSKQRR